DLRVIQVLLKYCVVFFCSRHQVQKSRTPPSGAHPETLHSGTRIQKTEELPWSAVCRLEPHDAVGGWRTVSFEDTDGIVTARGDPTHRSPGSGAVLPCES